MGSTIPLQKSSTQDPTTRTDEMGFWYLTFFDAFLPPASAGEDYYAILGVNRRAKTDEIRRAYRKLAVKCHPDKKQQRDGNSNAVDSQEFKRLHEAYETLMDPKKRRLYDNLGSKGRQYITNPQSISFQEAMTNLGSASCWKRTKFAALVALICFSLLLQPILICVNIDKTTASYGSFAISPYWPWTAVLTPLWIFDALMILLLSSQYYLARDKDDDDNDNEDREGGDRSTRSRRSGGAKLKQAGCRCQLSLTIPIIQFLIIVLTEIFLSLRLDGVIQWKFSIVFIPLYLHQLLQLTVVLNSIFRARSDINRMVTKRYLEREILKRPYADLTDEEKRVINEAFIITHLPTDSGADEEDQKEQEVSNDEIKNSAEYLAAQKNALQAQKKLIFFPLRALFLGLLIPQLDNTSLNLSWWLVFLPLWIAISCSCCSVLFDTASTYNNSVYFVKVEKNDVNNASPSAEGSIPAPTKDMDQSSNSKPSIVLEEEFTQTEEVINIRSEQGEVDKVVLIQHSEKGSNSIPSISADEECAVQPSIMVAQEFIQIEEVISVGSEPSEVDKVLRIQPSEKVSNSIPSITADEECTVVLSDESDEKPFLIQPTENKMNYISSTAEDEQRMAVPSNESDGTNSSWVPDNGLHGEMRPAFNEESLQPEPLPRQMPDSCDCLSAEEKVEEDDQRVEISNSEALEEVDLEEGDGLPSENDLDMDDDSDEYFMMMDEEKSVDAGKMALGRCCHLIWVNTMACLFVGKLQGAGYSAMWIIFPILLPAGCLLSSMCCLIYCSTADSPPEPSENDAPQPKESSSVEMSEQLHSNMDKLDESVRAEIKTDEGLHDGIKLEPGSGLQESDISDID